MAPGATERLVEALAARGYALEPKFLSAGLVDALRARQAALEAEGRFRPAAIGAGADRSVRPGIRGDRLCWLDPPYAPAEAGFLAQAESLRASINAALGLGLFDFECQYASYAPGTRYARHLDLARGGAERVTSLLLYLNDGWSAADGGALRLYTREGTVEVLPEGGTLVLFESARFEHEVCEAGRERLSIAGWFRRRARVPA